jgi:uncharacterized membrane protein
MSQSGGVWSLIKKYFLSGVLVVVPIILTYLVLRLLFNAVDSILQPVINHFFGISIPGLGIIATILLVFAVGLVTRNLLGSQLVELWDGIMEKMPVIRPIYSASKQLLEAMTSTSAGSFKEVVLIEHPRKGLYALGFVAQRTTMPFGGASRDMVTVFIPSTPTPMSGTVVIVPIDDITWLDMTVEAGLSYVVSGGVAVPKDLPIRVDRSQQVQGAKS